MLIGSRGDSSLVLPQAKRRRNCLNLSRSELEQRTKANMPTGGVGIVGGRDIISRWELRCKRRFERAKSGPDGTVHHAELDALRGIAILLVFATHASAEWIVHTKVPLNVPLLGVDALGLLRYGFLGVSLFFLLSGYLLTWTEEGRARAGLWV